jgi:DNA repair protein RadC
MPRNRRNARFDVFQLDSPLRRPVLDRRTDVFRVVVAPNHLRLISARDDLLELPNHPLRGQGEVHLHANGLLAAQNGLIEAREMFRGTVSQTAVYPREVVKAVLQANASGVILAHNHPSGVLEPSAGDRSLTDALRLALALVVVSVIDHLIVGVSRNFATS